ncbi:VOC family protein [Leptospira sp. 2 VSF19]|uniref:VOC family protein n=1 Tax=Leptospira soteropolitanensis TaxID=2950025 RepID=A0AAW5VER8_9LEPT|nr:VOC family protein [Leptospira soteropolitanensis]MCW7501063.1 VOC family protein [Leptospira soteropolitanensis]MCW7523257.1 VOC family protein [Leptospira soteropolitanensis]MCW7527118.1 VOC family protein [Leptospira soteropolitanensis]MCW7530975.1 VOC family protein [Leptospira soteropolitanensis]
MYFARKIGAKSPVGVTDAPKQNSKNDPGFFFNLCIIKTIKGEQMAFQQIQTGIITEKLIETKTFYEKWLGLQTKFESEWFVLLCLPNRTDVELAIMKPNQTQVRKSYFQNSYQGKGVWFIFESNDVKKEFEMMKQNNAPIDLPLTTEEWGDTHFTLIDPNGIGIDIVQERSTT